jgi:hypothetical protein
MASARSSLQAAALGVSVLALPASAQQFGPAPSALAPVPPNQPQAMRPLPQPAPAPPDLAANYGRFVERRRAEERALMEFMVLVPGLRSPGR